MPDWTYHPFFKPLLFRLPAEVGRRLTLRLLAVQGRTRVGRAVFRLFGHVHPPADVAVEAFGLRFPSPVGLGAGIDTHGQAVSVMQYLGFGFLEVGPATAGGQPHRFATEPRRIPELLTLVRSRAAAAPSAAALALCIREAPDLHVPVGMALAGDDLATAIAAAADAADFLVLPETCAPGELQRLRKLTSTPLLLRLSPSWSDAQLDQAIDAVEAAGLDGVVAVGGQPSDVLEAGELHGPLLRARALEVVARIRARSELPIIAAGGINGPEHALALLDAGATLVSLYDGLVYGGPGLPGRILHAVHRRHTGEPERPPPTARAPGQVPRWSWWLVAFTGLVLMLAGCGALYLAATDHMLPPDVAFLGMTSEELCRHHDCRIVLFMIHDRVAFGGSILTVGILYAWLAARPLRSGEAWAWWALLLSGLIGFGSFLTYIGYGYLDPWHATATALLLPWYVAGMTGAYRGCAPPRGLRAALRHPGNRAWAWSPAGLGRLAVSFAGIGMVLGGLTIMVVGMTHVFVPQDLHYMQLTVAQLDAINPRLVPLIAHDRAGFGGGLCSAGLCVMMCLWYGLRPASPGLWSALLASGLIGFGTAIGIHFVVGYTDFVHLAPAYAGALFFVLGMALLYGPMCRTDDPTTRFAEL